MHILSLIQGVDHRLLNLLIKFRVQRIDTDDLVKDLRIFVSDLRHRVSDDREASLIAPDIFICHLPGSAVIQKCQFSLFTAVCRSEERSVGTEWRSGLCAAD